MLFLILSCLYRSYLVEMHLNYLILNKYRKEILMSCKDFNLLHDFLIIIMLILIDIFTLIFY